MINGDSLTVLQKIIIWIIPMVSAIVFHEWAHGYIAYKFGDNTAKYAGRLTLNPLAHLDIFGTILLPMMLYFFSGGGMLFGYAKPVPVNIMNCRGNKKVANFCVAFAGPLTNIILAFIFLSLYNSYNFISDSGGINFINNILLAGLLFNLGLAGFNLIPIPPLDGSHMLEMVLPDKLAEKYDRLRRYGFMPFFAIILLSQLLNIPIFSYIIRPFSKFFITIFNEFWLLIFSII
ncbi:Site-2 protease family protein [Candidatus Magnetomoraceae bacterium gMMP-1]